MNHQTACSSPAFGVLAATFALLLVPTMSSAQGTLFVNNNRVGIGIESPLTDLHVSGDGTIETIFTLENQNPPGFRFKNGVNGATWFFKMNQFDTFVVSREGTGGDELRIKANGELIAGPAGVANLTLTPAGNLIIAGTLTQGSSRDIKKNFSAVDGRDVLARVRALPISEWSYENDAGGARHLGPMAEDFRRAFELGRDAEHLAPADLGGVALAAIQGLDREIALRDTRISELEAQVDDLRKMVLQLTEGSRP